VALHTFCRFRRPLADSDRWLIALIAALITGVVTLKVDRELDALRKSLAIELRNSLHERSVCMVPSRWSVLLRTGYRSATAKT
jgi:hypothetical protein